MTYNEIIEHIVTSGEGLKVFSVEFDNTQQAQFSVRRKLRLTNPELSRKIVIAKDGNKLVIYRKPQTRVEQLTRLLEKVLPSIDDEHLYDEALEVLYGRS